MATPTVQSVHKAFRLLQCFQDRTEWLTCVELGRRAGLSEVAAHRLMQTLAYVGVVVRNGRGHCRLNPNFQPFTESETQTRAPTLTLVANSEGALDRTG